jgi:hypothetical protein
MAQRSARARAAANEEKERIALAVTSDRKCLPPATRDAITRAANISASANITLRQRRRTGAEAVYSKLKAFFRKSKQQNAEPTEKQVERDVRGLLKGTKEGRIVIENENPERKKGVRKVIDEARPDDRSV